MECCVLGTVVTALLAFTQPSSQQLYEVDALILILQLEKPRHREVKQLPQSHTARKW